jgi:hypothetical protein
MARTTCLFLWLVLLVAVEKTHSEKQVLVAGKQEGQQGRWADQAGLLTGQSGLPSLFQAVLLCFVPTTSTLVLLKWMFHKQICVEQSFLRYLCPCFTRK